MVVIASQKFTKNSRSPRGTKERFYYNNGFYYNTHSASVPPHKGKGRSPYNINKLFLSCQEYHSPNTTEHIIYSWEGNRLGWKINHSNITHKNRHCPVMLGAETRNNQMYKLWWWCTERQGEGWWGKLAEVNSASWWASAREHRGELDIWRGGEGGGGLFQHHMHLLVYTGVNTPLDKNTTSPSEIDTSTSWHGKDIHIEKQKWWKTDSFAPSVTHTASCTPPPPPPFLLAHSSWNHLQKSEIQYA